MKINASSFLLCCCWCKNQCKRRPYWSLLSRNVTITKPSVLNPTHHQGMIYVSIPNNINKSERAWCLGGVQFFAFIFLGRGTGEQPFLTLTQCNAISYNQIISTGIKLMEQKRLPLTCLRPTMLI